jgi:small conductance mechanosensitive channel
MQSLGSLWQNAAPVVATIFFFSVLLWLANRLLFKKKEQQNHEHMFPRQMLMLLLMLMSVIALVISLPISEATQTQILSLIGLIISGLLAFSSTTIFSNLVAGAMMRFTRPFVTGDFIRVDNYAGRVTERGLFDCEVQTENRELIAIPNNFLINHPVTVVRSSGAIVSASLSLGYDVHHSDIEALLKQAASEIGLEEPFVHVTELGNFAVTYKISGLLLEVKNLITARSRLYTQVLDTLHSAGIEIMSPAFMNQRPLADEYRAIAQPRQPTSEHLQSVAEDIVFDKAEKAQQDEETQKQLAETLATVKQQLADAEGVQKEKLKAKIVELEAQIATQAELAKQVKKEE